jgi:hypothetical protein
MRQQIDCNEMDRTADSIGAVPPMPNGALHVLKYVELGTDREIEFLPYQAKRFEVKPLDFEQLVSAAASPRPSFRVSISNASAPSTATGLNQDGPFLVDATIETSEPLIAFGLVDGGWLPLPWAHKRIALLDRNVVIKLEKLQATHVGGNAALLTQWLGLDSETVSPLLFALEGSNRRPPSEFEMRAELVRAHKALRNLLPGAKVHEINSHSRRALHRMVVDNAEFRVKATRLLLKAAPLVAGRVKPERRLALETELCSLAAAQGVRRGCLTFLALLSCIYDSNPASTHRTAAPGRAVLKPTKNYTVEAAYNALSDLFFLELMFNIQTLFPEMNPVLYTADAGLAAFWTALQPCLKEFAHLPNGKSRTTMTFNMDGGLYPSLTFEEVERLSKRISSEL